jgi:plasmid stability protein
MGQITIYLPDELDQQIRALAADEHRSLSAEILYLLEQALTT